MPKCPECRDGKCVNCAGWALDEEDEIVQCDCDHGSDGK